MSTKIQVLLVDDEEAYARTLSKRLGKRDMKVSTASSGAEAVARMSAHPADVVVLDMKMPVLDGVQVLKLLRRECPDTEVLMLTGHADMDEAMAAMTAGAFDFLTKPVNIDLLTCRIMEAARARNFRQEQADRQVAC